MNSKWFPAAAAHTGWVKAILPFRKLLVHRMSGIKARDCIPNETLVCAEMWVLVFLCVCVCVRPCVRGWLCVCVNCVDMPVISECYMLYLPFFQLVCKVP